MLLIFGWVTNSCFYFDGYEYLHLRQHWPFWIKKFGAPAYYSTMHWESKHKQLKQIKERKTNNTNHSRDIAQKDVAKTVYTLRNESVKLQLVCAKSAIYTYMTEHVPEINEYPKHSVTRT